jgi:DNA polymerase
MLEEIGIHLWLPPTAVADASTDAAAQLDRPQASTESMAGETQSPRWAVGAGGDPPMTLAPIARHLDAVPVRAMSPDVVAGVSSDRGVAARPGTAVPQQRSAGAAEALVGLAAGAPLGVAAMDWPELQATVSDCRACGLCEGRRNTVFGVGHQQARWMLIGEAPGEQEDRDGEPFVGKAGQLLDNMLRAAGLTRSEASADRQVYIANVLKCRPPQNRNPLPDEVARCEPYLRRQVALVQPEVILAMGRFAVQSLLGSQEPIGRLRGRVHDYLGVPVVVTYHPAYLLRNPLDKSRSWEDLCLAHEVLHGRSAS